MAEKIVVEPYVAVDVGNFSLKFAYVVPGSDKPILKALAHMRIPPFTHLLTPEEREKMSREDVEKDALNKLQKFLTKHLTELLYDNQIQTKKAVTFASGRAVTIRYIELPPVPEKEAMNAAINAEAVKQMPFSMEKAVLGFSILGDYVKEDKAFVQVMVAALQKDIVSIIGDNLKGGGLSTEGILTIPQALELGIPHQIGVGKKDSKIAVIHCGHKTTSIMIFKGGKLNFYRDIYMAGETITEAILGGGEIDGTKIEFKNIDEVVELKHKIGVLPPDEIKALKGPEKFAAQQIFSTVEKIFQHIQLSISYYISQTGESGIEKFILTGGSAAMKNFKEFIQESLEAPVELANPFSNLSVAEINVPKEKLEEDAPSFAPTIGIAQYQDQENIINFLDILFPNRRKQTLDFSGVSSKFGGGIGAKFNFQLDERKLRILAGLIGTLLLIVIIYPFIMIRQNVKKAISDQKKYTQQLEELKTTQNEVTQLLADKERLGREAGFADEIRAMNFPNSQMLLELASITPKEIFIINLTFNRDEKKRTFRMTGHADTKERVFGYLKKLNQGQTGFFRNSSRVSNEEVPIDENHSYAHFVIDGTIQQPAPAAPAEGG